MPRRRSFSILHEPEALDEKTVNGTGDEKSDANVAEKSPDAETVFKWRKKEPAVADITFSGTELTCPDNVNELNPFMYFKMFWDDSITQNIVEQTNLYSVQQTGCSILTTKDEIETFLGLQMKMSIVKMPNYEMYWENQTQYEQVASVMPSKRYEKIRQFLVNNNTRKDESGNKDNQLYKVQPVIEGVQQNCLKIEQEICHSIDEQIIPAKTKCSGIRHSTIQRNQQSGG